ncbi:FecR domain-containing protein, partial [Thermodesulfobacteriota bacterium]
MKKILLQSVIIAAGLVSVCVSPGVCRQHPWQDSFVSHLQGTAYGRAAGGEEFGLLERNMPLEEGDALLAGPDGFMELTLFGGIRIWLNTDSLISIDRLYRRPRFALATGEIFFSNPDTTSDNTRVIIATPAARVCLTTGSLVQLSLAEDGELSVAVWEGSADIQGDNAVCSVSAGRRVTV